MQRNKIGSTAHPFAATVREHITQLLLKTDDAFFESGKQAFVATKTQGDLGKRLKSLETIEA